MSRWIAKFTHPAALVGLKVVLLVGLFLLAGLISPR